LLRQEAVDSSSARDSNHPGATAFPASVSKAVEELIADGKVRLARPGEKVIVNPLNAIIKNSDVVRARALTGIDIKCQADLDEVNRRIAPGGIKVRVVINMTGSGVNDLWSSFPFSSPTADDGLAMIERGGFLCKTDITAYCLQFCLATEFGWLVGIWYGLSRARQLWAGHPQTSHGVGGRLEGKLSKAPWPAVPIFF